MFIIKFILKFPAFLELLSVVIVQISAFQFEKQCPVTLYSVGDLNQLCGVCSFKLLFILKLQRDKNICFQPLEHSEVSKFSLTIFHQGCCNIKSVRAQ